MSRPTPGHPMVAYILMVLWMMATPCSGVDNNTPPGWQKLDGEEISSVAWSPNGKRIALVSTPRLQYDGDGPKRATIWLVDLPLDPHSTNLRRLTTLRPAGGLPVALFWMSDTEVAWAGAGLNPKGFSFWRMSISSSGPRPLVDWQFQVRQRRGMGDAYFAPDDVYWDAEAGEIMFTGGVDYSDVTASKILVTVVDLRKRSQETVALPAGIHAGVTLCGRRRGAGKSQFFLTGNWQPGEAPSKMILWRSQTYSLNMDKVIVEGELVLFPRLSPDGRTLAWLNEARDDLGKSELVLRDVKSGKQIAVAVVHSALLSGGLAMGCPFSWSPDSKQIACADNSTIRIVQVR